MNKYMNKQEFEAGWRSGLPETPCGRGSRMAETGVQRKWIPQMVAKYGIKSIADIGAGDMNWVKQTDLGCKYTAFDLIPRSKEVKKFDLLKNKLPKADCLMVNWVLNHLSPENQRKAMRKLLASDAKYLIITFDKRLESIIDQPRIESVLLRQDRGIDSEMRLIKLMPKPRKTKK